MKFTLSGNTLQVVRETTDPLKYYGGTWGDGESRVFYHVKRQLTALGFDLIKKRMWRDGHQQYLRVRNDKSTTPHIYLFNDHYAVTGLNDDWNTATDYLSAPGTWHEKRCNHLLLAVTFDVFGKQPDCRERLRLLLGDTDGGNGWVLMAWDGNPSLHLLCWRKKFYAGHVSIGIGEFTTICFSYGANSDNSFSSTRWRADGNITEQAAMALVDANGGRDCK